MDTNEHEDPDHVQLIRQEVEQMRKKKLFWPGDLVYYIGYLIPEVNSLIHIQWYKQWSQMVSQVMNADISSLDEF